ncbi:MAG TPA: substrate-binding domain-containing protein [Candidatus Binatia bacterium]|nr:substrate-binding domain-containing protein [Candidatus Binatia bacterium]
MATAGGPRGVSCRFACRPYARTQEGFRRKKQEVTINLTSGVSRQLAERILKGDTCDVFAPSSPAAVDEDLMNKKIAGSGKGAASWYVVFSTNEMVVVTMKGNPLAIRQVADLVKPEVKFVRVTGEKDLATNRTMNSSRRPRRSKENPNWPRRSSMARWWIHQNPSRWRIRSGPSK